MSIDAVHKGYPICDTDIWINVCKLNKLHLIFDRYNNIYMSDAVIQELSKKNEDDESQFGCGLEGFRESLNKNRLHVLALCNNEIFNEREKRAVLKEFSQHHIYYDEILKRFQVNSKHMGEKVSVIYASVLNLCIILSDDRDTEDFVHSNYRFLQVVKLRDLLYDQGLPHKQIEDEMAHLRNTYNEAAYKEIVMDEQTLHEKPTKLKSLKDLAKYKMQLSS